MSKKKIPNIEYGRLQESAHFVVHAIDRSVITLEWFLEDDNWKQVDDGFTDINKFLRSIAPLEGLDPERRKDLAQKLADVNASQRATAEILGVHHSTIDSDLKDNGGNPPLDEETPTDNEQVTNDSGGNPPLEENKEPEEVEVVDEYAEAVKNIETKIETITSEVKNLSKKIMKFNGELFEMEVESLKSLQSLYAMDSFGDLLRAVNTMTKYFGYQINDLNTQQNEKQNEIS